MQNTRRIIEGLRLLKKIINTNKDKCIACNKCIMVCPIKYANNVEIINDERKIEVDESRCITCGKCLKVCDHEARKYIDDLDDFLEDLKNGEKISIIVAPSFVPNQPQIYKHVFGYFKSLGVNLIYDVAFGANITSWGYVKYLENNKPQDFLISQPCPTIVNYIEKYTPDLIEKLMPIQSPAMCTAIYLKKYKNLKGKIAFISPCIAKKSEIERKSNEGLIDYNITFENLFSFFKKNNIDLINYPETDFDNNQIGLGVRFSKVGGLNENLLYHLPKLKIRQVDGPEKVFDYLKFLSKGFRSGKYDLIDILNCSNGCNVGTAACKEIYDTEISAEIENEILGYKRLTLQNEIEIDYEEYDNLFKYFNENLNLNDFYAKYTDRSNYIKYIQPNEEEFEQAFIDLKKYDEESRKINCYSCGYKTCKDMAIAIHNNYNIPASCHEYNRKQLEIQEGLSDYIGTILEFLTKSIIVTDPTGIIQFINQETQKLLGYEYTDFIQKHIQEFFPDQNVEEHQEMESRTCQFAKKNGDICHLQIENRSFELKGRKFLLFVLQDISQQVEVNNLKNNFISMISHELRTPMTSIKGALELMLSGAVGEMPDKAKGLLNIANNNVIRLVNLINEILDLEKIKAGKMDFKFNEYQIMPLIEEGLLLNESYAQQFNVRYRIKEDLKDALINVDKDRFIQILTNLLSNAAKFSHPGEDVKIYVKRNQHLISIFVVNKGQGIPPESYTKIFQSFYQVDSSNSRARKGSGLGLSICKSLVQNMGGTIGFDSSINGKTTFCFEFPEIYKHEEDILDINSENEYKKLNMLHVENDFDALNICQTTLRDLANITSATTLCEAESFLNESIFDVIVLDYRLPDGNCDKLINKVKNTINKQAKMVIFSAYDESYSLSNKVDKVLLKTKNSIEQLYECLKNIAIGDKV